MRSSRSGSGITDLILYQYKIPIINGYNMQTAKMIIAKTELNYSEIVYVLLRRKSVIPIIDIIDKTK
jgi:hypothetical protein